MPDLADSLIAAVSQLAARVAECERRMDSSVRHGKVTDVDTKKQLARIEIGERDGTPLKSAWVPYAQIAGDYKSHRPPTKGQQMTLFAPNGEIRQAMLLPFTWSDQNKSPSDKEDEHVTTFGKLKIVEKKDGFVLSVGNTEFEITTDSINLTAAKIRTIGKTITGIDSKSEDDPPKVSTVAGPAIKTHAKV